MDDEQLVRAAQQGDSSAYEELVSRWAARLLGYIRARVRHAEVAEDLAQDCLLRGFKKLDSLSNPKRFGAWLLSIAHHAVLDWKKARARREIQFHHSEYQPDPKVTRPGFSIENQERNDEVMHAIDALPEGQREAILIYYFDDVTYQELSTMLGISFSAVNARLTKARAALREKLCARGCPNEM